MNPKKKSKHQLLKSLFSVFVVNLDFFESYNAKFVWPISVLSTTLAHCRPSLIAQTTKDCPRLISPATHTFSLLVL